MKNKNKVFVMYSAIFILSLVATVTMRTVALFLHFDENLIYFQPKVLVSVANCLLVAVCILFITYIFTAGREVKLVPDFTSAATYIPTGLVSIALVFMQVALFKRSFETLEKIKILREIHSSEAATETLVFVILIITSVLSMLSIIHFALTALVESHSSKERANFGLCTVMFLSLYTIYLYFSSELPINAPNKMLDQMVYLFSAVFFLYETRLSLGRERWRQYIAFGFIAAGIAAYSSIPAIIYYFANGSVISNSIYEVILSFALFIFITARIFLASRLIEDKQSALVSALALASDTRDEAINPKITAIPVIDVNGEALEEDAPLLENQISIDDITADSNETTEETPVSTEHDEEPKTEDEEEHK